MPLESGWLSTWLWLSPSSWSKMAEALGLPSVSIHSLDSGRVGFSMVCAISHSIAVCSTNHDRSPSIASDERSVSKHESSYMYLVAFLGALGTHTQ